MSIQPRNAFYENLAIIEGRQRAVRESIDAIGNLPNPQELLHAIERIALAVAATGKHQAEALGRIADAQSFRIRPAASAPIAYLCIGVDTDASFNRASHIGRFLISACTGDETGERASPNDEIGLQQLCPPPPARAGKGKAFFVTRELFVGRAKQAAGNFDIPPAIAEEDYGRFYDMAPSLLALIASGK